MKSNYIKKTFFLCFIILSQFSFSQVFDVETILESGSNESRINLVILSDGYQSHELNQFVTDATNFSNDLFNETPYKEYKNYFNVHVIKVPSNMSGANHPGTATDVTEPEHPIQIVDNYFESTFDAYGIHRLLVSNSNKAINVLASNFPTYDLAMVLVNTPYYGGSGGPIAVSSLHASSSEIAIHELAHSFVDLKDEYYAGDVYAKEGINMTQETNQNDVKWANWVGQNNIGIYQYCCGGNSADWYHPSQNCKMQYLNSPFCSVCTEGTIEVIHSLTSPIDSYLPDSAETINLSAPIPFSISTIAPIPNTLSVEWTLNGTVIDNSEFSTLISPSDLVTGNNQLQATIEDSTSLLKIDNHETIHNETILWNIDYNPQPIDPDGDDDEDGIMNDVDICPNTPNGENVDANGCILLDSNNFKIESVSETCPDKDNGQIIISAEQDYDYMISINGTNHSMTNSSDLVIDGLAPDTYKVCIVVTDQTSPYCYDFTIEEGNTVSGKSSSTNGKSKIEILEGTAPFNVYINGKEFLRTMSSTFDLEVEHGDLIEVKTDVACEGVFSETIQLFDIITVYPNPTEGLFELIIPLNLNEVEIELYNYNSQLISRGTYTVSNGKVQLDLTNKSTGMYYVKVLSDKSVMLKIIKK